VKIVLGLRQEFARIFVDVWVRNAESGGGDFPCSGQLHDGGNVFLPVGAKQ
jgi:hypothetical protein